MAPASPVSRRISYIIPPPSEPRTKLLLPPLDTPHRGRTVPIVIPAPSQPSLTSSASSSFSDSGSSRRRPTGPRSSNSHSPKHSRSSNPAPTTHAQPKHRLGVSALAVDLSTHISGKGSPEGILYSAGRDGLVIATELGIPTRPRKRAQNSSVGSGRGRYRKGEWKTLSGWDDEDDDDAESSDDEDEEEDGDATFALENSGLDGIYGSAPRSKDNSRIGVDESLPYEKRWEVDLDRLDDFEPVKQYFTPSASL